MSQPGEDGSADFLSNYGNKYRTIHLHTLAIQPAVSNFHEYIDRLPVGKYHEICSLASAIFNSSPIKPRYMFFMGCQTSSRLC